MPFFRRTPRPEAPLLEFTVGLRDNRVVVGGGSTPGIAQLDELRDYVGAVTGYAGLTAEGRDPVAVLNAKMDFAELVNDTTAVVTLAFEELAQREVLAAAEMPPLPPLPEVPPSGSTYEYIQATHARAELRLGWLVEADGVLARHGVAVLPPAPPEPDRSLQQRHR